MTISEQLNSIKGVKSNIRQAIINQGVEVGENDSFASYANRIAEINNGMRNVGEIVTSTIPLTDAGLHLLDGALLSGDGIYEEFVDYIANLYENSTDLVSNVYMTGALTDDNGVISEIMNNSFYFSPFIKYYFHNQQYKHNNTSYNISQHSKNDI